MYLDGSVGQAVSGIIWLGSAALGSWVGTRYAILALALGGVFIFPLTQLVIRLMGRPASLRKENPFRQLAMQVAFIVPLCLPVITGATLYRQNWFYPAFLIVVGAHYLPFITLYGIWQYAILAGVLIGGGVLVGMFLPGQFTPGGWLGGLALVTFALLISRRKS